jgi:uncharacterized protein YggE
MARPSGHVLPVLVLSAVTCAPAVAQQPPTPVQVSPAATNVANAVGPTNHAASSHEANMAQEAIRPFIEVSGSASVAVAPDRALLSFAVETEGETAGEASGRNADLMAATLEAIRSAGSEARIETFGYTVQPIYRTDRQTQDPRIVGYRALNNVRVTISDIDGVGDFIDAGIGAGANRVAGLTFEASDTEAARLDALREAVRKARAEAGAIASSLGVALGPVLEVRGGAEVPSPRPYLMLAEMAPAATPIEAAEQNVTASVTIRYALGG